MRHRAVSRLVRPCGLPLAVATTIGLFACSAASPPPDPTLPTDASRASIDGIHSRSDSVEAWQDAQLQPLREFEERRRATTDFARLPSPGNFGADPFRVLAIGDGAVGLLRGKDAVVQLDNTLAERARFPGPTSPVGLTALDDLVFACGERSGSIFPFEWNTDGTMRPLPPLALPDVVSLSDLTAGPGPTLYAVDGIEDRLLVLKLARDEVGFRLADRTEIELDAGPFQVRRVNEFLLVNSLLAHSVWVAPLDKAGLPVAAAAARIRRDGPIWCFDALPWMGGIVVATGGAEDHPLDRSRGFFGYVDSYLELHLVGSTGTTHLATRSATDSPNDATAQSASAGAMFTPLGVQRLAELNLSQHMVITPKSMVLDGDTPNTLTCQVTGYGGTRRVQVQWKGALSNPPEVIEHDFPPGTTDLARLSGGGWAAANPLLDVWVGFDADAFRYAASPDENTQRGRDSKLGELLFFTTAMAPFNDTLGAQSRFTCETCHFEGYGDGRIHYTGRGNVNATTKPLRGLFNNRPYFTRALDEDLTEMVNAEFRVAGAGSGSDPWFTLWAGPSPTDNAAANELGGTEWISRHLDYEGELSALELRRSLMTYLMEFTHAPNPLAQGRDSLTDLEQRGAAVFAQRCAACHAPRLITDQPATAVTVQRWASTVLSPQGPLVWASDGYQQTGVVPYVHVDGARTTSLRRLYKKRPYFTNGSADDLRDLLEMVRFDDDAFWHATSSDDPAASQAQLDDASIEALIAFLRLL